MSENTMNNLKIGVDVGGTKIEAVLVDGAPKAIKEKISKADADALKEKLEAAGATVEVK